MRAFIPGRRKARVFPRLAVIGCGAVATFGHLPALGRLGWRPHVLVDPCIERAERLAGRWKAARVAGDVSELAAGEIEAAVIAAPASLHARIGLPLLEAGVHVLVEKPFATSAADARAMVETAAGSGACVAVGHLRRFLFVNRWIKAVLDGGALGDVEHVDFQDGSSYHSRPRGSGVEGAGWNSPTYWDAGLFGGGVLMDFGSHALDTLLWWLGPADVAAYRDDALGGMEADARLDLAFACGATGTVRLSRIRTLRNSVVIAGSRGRIEASLYRNELRRVEPEALRGFKLDGRSGAAMPDREMWGPRGPGETELRDWLDAIRRGRAPLAPGASAAPVAELVDRCYASREPLAMPWQVGRSEEARAGADGPEAAGGLRGRTVLVTGGTGFIGGRLVERLVEGGATVRAGVRGFRKAARLARFAPEEVELRPFDMDKEDARGVDDLVAGCDTVFHLAVDYESHEANIKAVRSLGAACLRRGVRRLVFTSSVSVYRPLPDGPLDETHPVAGEPANPNVSCQREVMRMIREDGLEATVLQPTHVYGPFGGDWTERQVEALIAGPVVLAAPGDGICNAVYVDDMVDALLLAAVRDEAAGEVFLISGAEHPTWPDFHRHYARAVGRAGGIRLLTCREIRARELRSPRGLLRVLKRYAARRPRLRALLVLLDRVARSRLRPVKPLVRAGVRFGRRIRGLIARPWRAARDSATRRPGEAAGAREALPSAADVERFAPRCAVRIDKARRLLGYRPAFSLERGMALTTKYVRWAHGHRCPGPAADRRTDPSPRS